MLYNRLRDGREGKPRSNRIRRSRTAALGLLLLSGSNIALCSPPFASAAMAQAIVASLLNVQVGGDGGYADGVVLTFDRPPPAPTFVLQ